MSNSQRTSETEAFEDVMSGLFVTFLKGSSVVTPRAAYMQTTPQGHGVPPPPLQLDYDASQPVIDLPKPDTITVPRVDLRAAIEGRRSVRSYSEDPLTLNDLSWLLWCTQGVKRVRSNIATLRTVPSGGSRHPFETYLVINNVTSLPPGLYRFLAVEHQLLQLDLDEGLNDAVKQHAWNQAFITTSAVTFLWACVPYRSFWRYGRGAFKVQLVEVGHLCQNLYLAAEAIDCGVCAIGAYDLDAIHRTLHIDDGEQFVVYLATVGKKRSEA
jgi:SagB-type dehydrogenase family enzyme